jgi:hypothetical protein
MKRFIVLRLLFALILSFSLFACSDGDDGGGSSLPPGSGGGGGGGGGDVPYTSTVDAVYTQSGTGTPTFTVEDSSGNLVKDFMSGGCITQFGVQTWAGDPEILINLTWSACNTRSLAGSYIFSDVLPALALSGSTNYRVSLIVSPQFYYEFSTSDFIIEETLPNGNIITLKG